MPFRFRMKVLVLK